jgi:large subunit ribosomal protein L9
MDIILREDIENLGFKDELISVKPGYARNFLIPQGKAVAATVSNRKVWEENTRQRSHKEAKVKDEAEKTAKALKDAEIKVGAKVGEAGKKIFGSVNNIQIADAITKMGYTVDKKNIKILGSQIKEVGKYQAEIRLHKDVDLTIDFEVVAE